MNSYQFMGIDFEEGEEEVTSRKKSFVKRAIAFIKRRRGANRLSRNSITRDRSGAHERLVAAFFSEEPMYGEVKFRKTFRMALPLFNEIVTAVIDHDPFFRNNIDCTGKVGISGLLKCTSSIRQLAYGVHAEFLDEYMQISERTSRTALDHFCQDVMQIYGPEYFRKPTATDVEKLYLHHEEKHGFSGMLRSLDCTDWEWFGCPYAFKAQYVRRDHAPEIPFEANGVTYRSGYYLVDGIYPELASLVKTILEPADDDHKRILYKQKQESARKDVERAFVECLIILLRNIDHSNGLCNWTRLLCKSLDTNMIDAEIVVGQHVGKRVFVPSIPLCPSNSDMFPFKLKRNQFPVGLSFAMTINKAQGQTIPNVGVYLPDSVFSHRQL
ncbi:ALP1-like protein isoform X1 [Tanacetum coccineum]